MNVKTLNISLPPELITLIDQQAKLHFSSRSEYIKATLILRLKADGILNNTMTHASQSYDEARKANLKAVFDPGNLKELKEDIY